MYTTNDEKTMSDTVKYLTGKCSVRDMILGVFLTEKTKVYFKFLLQSMKLD